MHGEGAKVRRWDTSREGKEKEESKDNRRKKESENSYGKSKLKNQVVNNLIMSNDIFKAM